MPIILHISRVVELNGAQQSLLLLIEGLNKKGYKSIVVVPRPGPLTDKLEMLETPVVYAPQMKPWLLAAEKPAIKRAVYNILQIPFLLITAMQLKQVVNDCQVDIIHSTTAEIFDGALTATLTKTPHIWHIRETIEAGKPRRFFLGAGTARKLIKHFSDRVVVCSKALGQAYINKPDDAHKIRVVHNGVNLRLFENTFSKAEIRQRLNIPQEATVIAMVAQRTPHKRHEDFLRAAVSIRKEIPNCFFLIVGSYVTSQPGEYENAMVELSKNLDLTKQLIWLDFQDKIQEIFIVIDLLVHPSEDEPFGRVLIEAMAAQKPVVATNVGGIPEIVIDGETGILVPPRSPDELAEAIIKMFNSPDLANRMGWAGRLRVEKHFTMQVFINNIENIYRELLP